MLVSQVYCVWRVVKTLTIIFNNPVFLFFLGASPLLHQNHLLCYFVHVLSELKFHSRSCCLLLPNPFFFPPFLFCDITVSLLIPFVQKCSLYLSLTFKKFTQNLIRRLCKVTDNWRPLILYNENVLFSSKLYCSYKNWHKLGNVRKIDTAPLWNCTDIIECGLIAAFVLWYLSSSPSGPDAPGP